MDEVNITLVVVDENKQYGGTNLFIMDSDATSQVVNEQNF